MLEKFEASVRMLLNAVPAMTLATCANGTAWATDVYFAADGYELVFFSSPASRHCKNLNANPSCAATVHPEAASWRDIRGLQMDGLAEPVETVAAKDRALTAYFTKFPFARDLMSNPGNSASTFGDVSAHVFRPSRIRYLDNTLGFGTRLAIRLENGMPAGPPEHEAG